MSHFHPCPICWLPVWCGGVCNGPFTCVPSTYDENGPFTQSEWLARLSRCNVNRRYFYPGHGSTISRWHQLLSIAEGHQYDACEYHHDQTFYWFQAMQAWVPERPVPESWISVFDADKKEYCVRKEVNALSALDWCANYKDHPRVVALVLCNGETCWTWFKEAA